MAFTPQDLQACRSLLSRRRERPHRIFLADAVAGDFEGTPVAVLGPMLGAPQAVLVMEKAIALGVRRVIAYGWCGSLQPAVAVGDVVLPTKAFSEEGTSAHYPLQGPARPSPTLLHALRRALAQSQLTLHEGSVWSTDAPYRETEAKVLAYRDRGVLGVEMEMAALLTVAAFRGIEFAGVLVVSDDLSHLRWRHGFKDPGFIQTRKRLPQRILQALSS